MNDQTTVFKREDGVDYLEQWHDNGNGTFSRHVYVDGVIIDNATLTVNEPTLDAIKTATETTATSGATAANQTTEITHLSTIAGGTTAIEANTTRAAALGQGNKTVTTAGTDVALAASTACKWVTLEALSANTGYIAVGGAGVDATATTGSGVRLAPGDTVTIEISNLAAVYIDSTVNGEGVRYTYGA